MKRFAVLILTFSALAHIGTLGAAGGGEAPSASFRLPPRTGVFCPPELKPAVAELAKLAAAHQLKLAAATEEQAQIRLKLQENGAPEHPQGYSLTVDATGVAIASRSAAGLFYGLQTLRGMLTDAATPALPYRKIAEQPEFDMRAVAFSLRECTPEKIDHLKRYLRTAAALKYNCAVLEFGDNFPYRDKLLPARKHRFSEADIRGILDFAAAHYIQVVPMLRVWSDCPLLAAHPSRDELLEVPYGRYMRYSYCPENPEVRRLVAGLVGGELGFFKTGEFFFYIDRLGFRRSVGQCARCAAVPLRKLVDAHRKMLKEICSGNGAKAGFILGAGSFPGNAPGVAERQLPDDIADSAPLGEVGIMKQNIRAAAKAGRKRFILTAMPTVRNGALPPLNNNTPYSTGGLVDGAVWLWSGADAPRMADPVAHFFALLHETVVRPPAGEASPVPLDGAVNAELNQRDDFPSFSREQLAELERQLDAGPEKLRLVTKSGIHYYGVLLSGSAILDDDPISAEIPLGGVRCKAANVLLTCTAPLQQAEYSPGCGGRGLFAQPQAAKLTLRYENDRREQIPLKYMNGIMDWNRPYGGYKLRTGASGADLRGRHFRFDILRVKNPHPELPLKSVIFSSSRHDGIAPVLLALSLEDRQGGEPAPGNIDSAKLPLAKAAADREKWYRPLLDFENSSLGKAYVETNNMTFPGGGSIVIDYPLDGTSPSHGRVLKLAIPPATPQNPEQSMQLTVSIPGSLRGTVKAIGLACRVEGAEYLRGSWQSIVSTFDKSSYTQIFHPNSEWNWYWCALDNPDVLSVKPLRDPRRGDVRRIVFAFRALPRGACVLIDAVGDSRVARQNLPWFTGE